MNDIIIKDVLENEEVLERFREVGGGNWLVQKIVEGNFNGEYSLATLRNWPKATRNELLGRMGVSEQRVVVYRNTRTEEVGDA